MSVLLVTYDLDKEPNSDDYKKILKIIKEYAWARLSESSYAIETNSSPKQIYSRIEPHLDQGDHILIITLKKPYYGYHSKEVIKWLDKRLTY